MSHFSHIKTKLGDGEVLRRALQRMGHEVEGPGEVRGWQGKTQPAELIIRRPEGYDIGFRAAGGEFEMVVDTWGLKIDADELLRDAVQHYGCLCVRDQAELDGDIVIEEVTLEDGSIRLVIEAAQAA